MNELADLQKRAWAQIDLDSIQHNFLSVKCKTCCVVKANAYGHGAVQLSKLFESLGATYLAVSNIEEAIQLRKANITLPILILGYTPVKCAKKLAQYDLEQTIYNIQYANDLNERALSDNVRIKVHIKIDTGMGRIGFQYHDGVDELELAYESAKKEQLTTIGIFTHFAISDEGDNAFTRKQFDYFSKAIVYLEKRGLSFKVKHCSNSAAIIDYPEFHLDMVRAGLSLYGINPTRNKKVSLSPALSLWSVVSNVKTIRKGDSVSYGRTFVADNDMQIATIPIGYADGFWRSNQGSRVYLNGEYCKIIGRVCMDQIMIECKNAKIGDLVEIYGQHVTVEEVAEHNGTIPYEVLCSIGERVPRVYVKNGEIVEVVDRLI